MKSMLKDKSGFLCPSNILLIIEIHTLIVMLFHSYMSPIYVFSGASILFLKGLFFLMIFHDKIAIFDIIASLFLILLVWDSLPGFLWTTIFVYLIIRTFAGLLHIGHHH